MRRAIGWAALALVVMAGVVHAGAPADQYSFFSAGDPEIEDEKTMLTWQRRPDQAQPKNFSGAVASCVDLGTGWRLPTVKELLTIVDEETYGVFEVDKIVYRAIDRNAFPGTQPENFWTSSPRPSNGEVWVVNFATGATASRNTTMDQAYVRCVKNQ